MYVQLDRGVCVPVGLCLSASSKGAPSIHPSNPNPDHLAHHLCIFAIVLIQVGGVCGWACADLLATLDRFLQFHRFLLLCSSFSWILLLDPPPGSFSWILLLDPSPGSFSANSSCWTILTILLHRLSCEHHFKIKHDDQTD